MYYGIGALILLIGIIALIRYIIRSSESKESCSVDNEVSPPEEKPDDEVAEIGGIEIDIKDQE